MLPEERAASTRLLPSLRCRLGGEHGEERPEHVPVRPQEEAAPLRAHRRRRRAPPWLLGVQARGGRRVPGPRHHRGPGYHQPPAGPGRSDVLRRDHPRPVQTQQQRLAGAEGLHAHQRRPQREQQAVAQVHVPEGVPAEGARAGGRARRGRDGPAPVPGAHGRADHECLGEQGSRQAGPQDQRVVPVARHVGGCRGPHLQKRFQAQAGRHRHGHALRARELLRGVHH
mmetsp:Transcript_70779/g.200855  ORF Transcript_70779/g.200855 Transcript_70779/m.200855 type:complete len:227 (-) Transcript_70779:324-1004(-)